MASHPASVHPECSVSSLADIRQRLARPAPELAVLPARATGAPLQLKSSAMVRHMQVDGSLAIPCSAQNLWQTQLLINLVRRECLLRNEATWSQIRRLCFESVARPYRPICCSHWHGGHRNRLVPPRATVGKSSSNTSCSSSRCRSIVQS